MNVKAGQKAIIIKAVHNKNLMRVVYVDNFIGDYYFDGIGLLINCWKISGLVKNNVYCPDAWLRPVSDIPDKEYEDEQIKLLENV